MKCCEYNPWYLNFEGTDLGWARHENFGRPRSQPGKAIGLGLAEVAAHRLVGHSQGQVLLFADNLRVKRIKIN